MTPTLTHRLQKRTNSTYNPYFSIQYAEDYLIKGDRLVCGNWLLFHHCLVYVGNDGLVSSDCSVDLSHLFKNGTCVEICTVQPLAHIQFADKCDRLLIVTWPCPCVDNPTPYTAVISLSDDGTASEHIAQQQQNDIGTSVLMLSVLPSFTFSAHDSDCQYTDYVLSPNGRFLGIVCINRSDTGIDVVVRLFNVSSSSSLPIWTLATQGLEPYNAVLAYNPPLLSFSPNSQYMAFQKRFELVVYDLTLPSFKDDPLVLSTKLAFVYPTILTFTKLFSYPSFTVDSMYLNSLYYYVESAGYDTFVAPVYAVHPQAHTASVCKVAGRDLTAAEWQEVGLGEKDHPICPGPVYDGTTCFGVPFGQLITVGGPIFPLDTCLLDSYSFAVQFSFTAAVDGSHEVKVESEYSTDIGVYDASCKTLAYNRSASSVKVPSLFGGQKVNIIVTSSSGEECGPLSITVRSV
eukprot:CAMPEP_0184673816 /NCGR_PEP_ID=MMETSP0308-20130426/86891_1 /TAXON_ID=38269 /ORGANISM="Gloeochaete witrockiana, Strain SAG 46.84" /LENGTH=459 /DNA_ID=CAMNT_0027121345 /DNA_START=59 /DNA_END=1438 /DNA_ORIENTATION=-